MEIVKNGWLCDVGCYHNRNNVKLERILLYFTSYLKEDVLKMPTLSVVLAKKAKVRQSLTLLLTKNVHL